MCAAIKQDVYTVLRARSRGQPVQRVGGLRAGTGLPARRPLRAGAVVPAKEGDWRLRPDIGKNHRSGINAARAGVRGGERSRAPARDLDLGRRRTGA